MNNYNFSKYDVLNTKQQEKNNINYYLNNMSACINKGLVREKQEDSVLLLEHPFNKDFKLIAVADGMGGLLNGGKASNLELVNIIKWFESLPSDYYYKENQILIEIYEELEYIDLQIRKYCNTGGTTLALTIFTKNNNICINVGDSRIYMYAFENLKQVSIDHSISWDLYEKGLILEKDNIRFHKKNHLITSRLGCENKILKIDKQIISVNDYEILCLFTDGVTDCLSDNQIEEIIKNNKNKDIASVIIKSALAVLDYNNNLNPEEYYSYINGGKDNLSAAVYVKKRK